MARWVTLPACAPLPASKEERSQSEPRLLELPSPLVEVWSAAGVDSLLVEGSRLAEEW